VSSRFTVERFSVRNKRIMKSALDRLWGPPSLLMNGRRKLFPLGQSRWSVKLTTHLQLVPRSRKLESVYPIPYTCLLRSAWLLKRRDNFMFALHFPPL
jgi:hypothetical protein